LVTFFWLLKGGQMVRGTLYIFLLGVFIGFVACDKSDDSEAQAGGARGGGRQNAAASPVKVESVIRGDISQYILKNTTLEAERWVDIRSRTTGQVVAILKEEGDPISAGTVIARLDSDAARINVLQRDVAYREAQQGMSENLLCFSAIWGVKKATKMQKPSWKLQRHNWSKWSSA
jgi:multidrug efflux pump subunit AcrA (membrane-fusion protein)